MAGFGGSNGPRKIVCDWARQKCYRGWADVLLIWIFVFASVLSSLSWKNILSYELRAIAKKVEILEVAYAFDNLLYLCNRLAVAPPKIS